MEVGRPRLRPRPRRRRCRRSRRRCRIHLHQPSLHLLPLLMPRLVPFLGTALVLLALLAAFNWWVDPFGEFWKPSAVADARAARPQCLVSHEVIGGEYLPFKLDVFRARPTRTFVTGSSRVLKIGSRPGERTFANLGMPVISPEIVLQEVRALPARPLTMYLGVEAFWLNRNFQGFDVSPG